MQEGRLRSGNRRPFPRFSAQNGFSARRNGGGFCLRCCKHLYSISYRNGLCEACHDYSDGWRALEGEANEN